MPSRFKISTPLGSYNPDWAVLINDNGEKKLYFVLETKRENSQVVLDDNLRQTEKDKIYCGKRHFQAIQTEAHFRVVTRFNDFIRDPLKNET